MGSIIPEGPKRWLFHGEWRDQSLIEKEIEDLKDKEYKKNALAMILDFATGDTQGVRNFKYSPGTFILPYKKVRIIVKHVEGDLYDFIHVYRIQSEDLPKKDREKIDNRIAELTKDKSKIMDYVNGKGLVK